VVTSYICNFCVIYSYVEGLFIFIVTIILKTRGEVNTEKKIECLMIMNLQFLCHELLNREENPSCCKDEPEFRCWRHYLKSVNVQIQSQSETEKPKTFGDKDLMNTLNHIDTSKEVQFSMNWSRDLV